MSRVPDQVEAEELAGQQFNAADPKQVNAARKKAARLDKQRLDVVEALMQNIKTRAWLYDLLNNCDMFGNPLVAGDTHMTYFKLGQQNMGKMLLQDVMQFPDQYVLMMNESRNRK